MIDYTTPLLVGIVLMLTVLIFIALFAAFQAHRAATREIGEKIVQSTDVKIVTEKEIVPFPDRKVLDVDAHLIDLTDHIEEFGIKGKNARDMLQFLYGDAWVETWSKNNRKEWHHEED